jgi:hypothetical protein
MYVMWPSAILRYAGETNPEQMGHAALVASRAWRPLYALHAPGHDPHLCGPAPVPKGVQAHDWH